MVNPWDLAGNAEEKEEEDVGLNDLDLHSKSQDYKNARTCAVLAL